MTSRCVWLIVFWVVGPAAAAEPVAVGSLKAVPPEDWKAEKPSNRLRSYQFQLPGEPSAELAIFPDSHPDPAKSFPRWRESFAPPEGMTLDDVVTTKQFDHAGATFHWLDVHGTWHYKERPFDPKSKQEERPNYRVVWVIVVEKDRATHLRLSGREEVVNQHAAAFETWLKSLK